ncbi:MAG: 30S ribosomal protein S11 [Bacteroidota bacterium]
MAAPRKSKAKKRKVIVSSEGIAHIKASFNNIIVTLTNKEGQTISWSSAGEQSFKGAKKSTPFAAKQVARSATQKAYNEGLRSVEVRTKGIGLGREHAIRSLTEEGLEVTRIKDITPQPFNGCRPSKPRKP